MVAIHTLYWLYQYISLSSNDNKLVQKRRLVNPFDKCMVKNFQDFECIEGDS